MAQRRKKGSRGVPVFEPGIDHAEQSSKAHAFTTPETRAKLCKSSYERMLDAGDVSADMHNAALEIEAVYMARVGLVSIKPPSYELISPGATGDRELKLIGAYHDRFKPWADELSRRRSQGGLPALETVIDVVIDGHTLGDIDSSRHWGNGLAKYIVRRALLEYAVMARWCKADELVRLDLRHRDFAKRAA